jgi:hypothetical protein
VLAAMIRVADQSPSNGIDHVVQQLQRNLTDEHGAIVRDFSDIDTTITVIDRQLNRAVNAKLLDAGGRPCASGTEPLESQLAD